MSTLSIPGRSCHQLTSMKRFLGSLSRAPSSNKARYQPMLTSALLKYHKSRESISRRRYVPFSHPNSLACMLTTVRFHSSRSSNFKLDALPFSISPEEALEKWRQWAEDDQNLKYLLSYNSIRIGAAYCPVWTFDLNIQFPKKSTPPLFQTAFGSSTSNNGTIHLPGLSAYAGYSYRRSLVNPVHSTSLVFMGDQTEPFGGWMLRDMKLKSTGAPISIVPDAWNATQGRAVQLVRQDLQTLVDAAWDSSKNGEAPKVKLQVVDARRVYMPTFVVDYKILGLEYRAFVSGCDQGAAVAGVSHQILGEDNMFLNPEYHQAARNFLAQPLDAILRRPGLVAPLFGRILTAGWFLFINVWARIPIIGLFVGSLAGFRKVYQPWMDNRRASAEWERQRENEAKMEEDDDVHNNGASDDFVDYAGTAKSYFYRNKSRILNDLGGDAPEHEQGQYGWFEDWQEWSRKQWAQTRTQQQQQQQSYYQQQSKGQQQQRQTGGAGGRNEYHWDFDSNDPYSVLGLSRGSSKEQVSQAFRKQMLKYHPDTQPNASEAKKTRLVERSKLITEAYRKIKTDQKRR